MNKTPSQTEMDEVFCAFYELSHRYKMIYGVDYKSLIKVLEFWNELGKEEIERLESLKYEPRMKAPTFPEYNKDGTIVGMSIRDILQIKISYLEATTCILSLEALLLTKLKEFGYKIEPYIQLSEEKFNHIISEEHEQRTKKLKGAKTLATDVANHPNFLKLGKRGLKKLVNKIQKGK